MYKILYVCPFAHYSGHHPHVAVVEPETLEKNGNEVTLLTFCGIINNEKARVNHIRITKGFKILQNLRKPALTRWVLMFFETLLTLYVAAKLFKKNKFDVIHVRDGEPFVFIPFLISLFHKDLHWFISLTAAIIHPPEIKGKSILIALYVFAIKLITSKIWLPLYKFVLDRNKFVFSTQNEISAQGYRKFMNGVLKKNIVIIPWGINSENQAGNKEIARKKLEIQDNKLVILSFGAPHSGKNMETIFDAVSKQSDDILLIHAGTHAFSLGSNTQVLASKYNLNGKAKVFNYFIPEHEKHIFFDCADVIVLSYTKVFASESSMLWEASKYNLPVIASNANLLGEDVKRYELGLLFEAENPKSLTEAINEFKKLKKEKLEIFRQGRKRFLNEHSDLIWNKRCNNAYEKLVAA